MRNDHCTHWLNESLPCCDCGDDSDGEDENSTCTAAERTCSAKFDELTLRAGIVARWGEYGAHVDVFDHMLKLCRERDEAFAAGAAAEREACRQEIEQLRDEVAGLTFQVQATAADPSQVVPLAFGRVRDAGGGEVHVVVDRATQTYPYVGAAVAIVMALGIAGRYDEPGAIPAAGGPVEPPPTLTDAQRRRFEASAARGLAANRAKRAAEASGFDYRDETDEERAARAAAQQVVDAKRLRLPGHFGGPVEPPPDEEVDG